MPSIFNVGAAALLCTSLSGAVLAQQKALPTPVDVRVVNQSSQAVPVTVMNQPADHRPEMYRIVPPQSGLAVLVPKPAAGRRFVATNLSFTLGNFSGGTVTAAGCNILLDTTEGSGSSSVLVAAVRLENANTGYWSANESVSFVLSDNQSLSVACGANTSNNNVTATASGYSESAQ